jgi:hypothetical protein
MLPAPVVLTGPVAVLAVDGICARSRAGGLVAGAIRSAPVPLPPTQSPLPLTADDCWPMDEPFDFELSLFVIVASANAAVVGSESVAAKMIFFMMFILPWSAPTIPGRPQVGSQPERCLLSAANFCSALLSLVRSAERSFWSLFTRCRSHPHGSDSQYFGTTEQACRRSIIYVPGEWP